MRKGLKDERETIVGLVTALKIYLELDEGPLLEKWERKARWMADKMKTIPNVEVGVTHQTSVEEKEPIWPLCYVEVDEDALEITARDLSRMLRDGDPSIEAGARGNRLIINPEFLLEGDESIITDRIKGILSKGAQ